MTFRLASLLVLALAAPAQAHVVSVGPLEAKLEITGQNGPIWNIATRAQVGCVNATDATGVLTFVQTQSFGFPGGNAFTVLQPGALQTGTVMLPPGEYEVKWSQVQCRGEPQGEDDSGPHGATRQDVFVNDLVLPECQYRNVRRARFTPLVPMQREGTTLTGVCTWQGCRTAAAPSRVAPTIPIQPRMVVALPCTVIGVSGPDTTMTVACGPGAGAARFSPLVPSCKGLVVIYEGPPRQRPPRACAGRARPVLPPVRCSARRPRVLGQARFSLKGGEAGLVKVRLTRAARNTLRARRAVAAHAVTVMGRKRWSSRQFMLLRR